MTKILITLSEDEFDDRYPLVENHMNPYATWGFVAGRGCLFETRGEEFEFVRHQNPATIWTLVDADNGDWCILSGLHYVNRVGYLISREPVPDGVTVEVHIPLSADHTNPG